MTLTNHYYD